MIPEAAVEAAADTVRSALWGYITADEAARTILEAATPHMLADVISTLNDQVWRLENTLVDECDYPALCAQRQSLIGAIETLQEVAK